MSASKFRERILLSAKRMAVHIADREAQPKPAPKTKASRKRKADAVPKFAEDHDTTKRRKTRATTKGPKIRQNITTNLGAVTMPLGATLPVKLNSQAGGMKPQTSGEPETTKKPTPPCNQHAPACPQEVEKEQHAALYQAPVAISRRSGPVVEIDTQPHEVNTEKSMIPTMNPKQSISGADKAEEHSEARTPSDVFSDNDSVFEALLKTTPEILGSTSTSVEPQACYEPQATPIKMPTTVVPETPTPPSLISSIAPSPASVRLPLPPPASPVKPFMRLHPSALNVSNSINLVSFSPDHKLLTCFRIAEVIRLQSAPISVDEPAKQNFKLELYARIKSMVSHDKGSIVQFADTFFPTRPPYLIGICVTNEASAFVASGTGVNYTGPGVSSCQSLEQGNNYKICEAVIRPKIGSAEVDVLSLRESSWEEVRYMRDILEPKYQKIPEGVPKGNKDEETVIVKE